MAQQCHNWIPGPAGRDNLLYRPWIDRAPPNQTQHDPSATAIAPRPPMRTHRCTTFVAARAGHTCDWPQCGVVICTACRNRNRRNFDNLLDALWLNVCEACRSYEKKRSRRQYVARRCNCHRIPQGQPHAGRPWNYCETHMNDRWAQILIAARQEYNRRLGIDYRTCPRNINTIRRRRPCLTALGARRRREADRVRRSQASMVGRLGSYWAGLPPPPAPPAPQQVPVPRCVCGREAGYATLGIQRAAVPAPPTGPAVGLNAHYRTRMPNEIRNCIGCRTLYDPTHPNGPQVPRSQIAAVGHPHHVALTNLLDRDNTSGFVRRGDNFW